MAKQPRLSPAEQEVQDYLAQVSSGQAGIDPQAQTLSRSFSNRAAQRYGQRLVEDRLDQNARNAEDAQQEAERAAKEAAKAQEDAQKEAAAAARAEQARNVRAAAAQGVATTTDIETGRRTIQTHPDGQPVYKVGPVGPVQPIGTQGVAIQNPDGSTRALPNTSIMTGGDGAAATTGEPERSTVFAQPIRDDRGNIRQVTPEPKTDKATGFQYVPGTDKSTGLPTKTTVGVDADQRRANQLGEQMQALDLRDNAVKQAQAAFLPRWKPIEEEYGNAKAERDRVAKTRFEKAGESWVKVSEDGTRTPATPEQANTHQKIRQQAEERFARAQKAYSKDVETAGNLERNVREIAEQRLKLTEEKIRIDAGLPPNDGGVAFTLAEAEAGPSPATQAAAAAAEEIIPPDAPKPLTESEALAKAFGSVPGIESVTLEGTSAGYSWLMRDGMSIGRVDNRSGSPVIILKPEATDLQAHIAKAGEGTVPVYLADNPNRPTEQDNAAWAAGVMQVAAAPAQGPLPEGETQLPEVDRDAELKRMGASYDDIVRRVKDGTLSVRMGEALIEGIYGETLKAPDPTAPETFQKFLAGQSPEFQSQWAEANRDRDPAKIDALRGEFISRWYAENQHKPGVTWEQMKQLRGNREARGMGDIAESMAKGVGGVAVDAIGSMGGMIGGTAALIGLTIASPVSDTASDLRKSHSDTLGRAFTNFNRGIETNFKKHLTDEGKARLKPLADSSFQLKFLIENRHELAPEEFKAQLLAAAAKVGKDAYALHQLNLEDGWAVEPSDFDVMQDRALGASLLTYAETGDPAAWEDFQRRLLMDKGSRQADELASETTAGKGRLAAAFAGGVNAPPQEMLIELLSSVATFGAGKAIGTTTKTAIKGGAEGTRLARLRRAMAGISDDFKRFGQFTDTLANPASKGKRLANKAIGLAKANTVEAAGEAVEEGVAGMADPTATAESVLAQAGTGFVGGFILGPLMAIPGAITQGRNERAARMAQSKGFADWYNRENADTEGFSPLAPQEAEAALAMLDPTEHARLVADHQQALAEFKQATEDVANSQAPGEVGVAGNVQLAWRENAVSRMSRAMSRAAETRAAVANYVGGVVEAAQSTKGMEAPARAKIMGLTKAATGRTDLLTSTERQAIAGLQTKDGAPYFADVNGRTVFTAEGRAEVLAENPLVGGLIQTDESRALIEQAAEAEAQAADRTLPESQRTSGENGPSQIGQPGEEPAKGSPNGASKVGQPAGTPQTLESNEQNPKGQAGAPAAEEAPQAGQAAGQAPAGDRGGETGAEAAVQPPASPVAPVAPNPAELDAAEYEALRQTDPSLPDIPTVVANAKAAGRPVSKSMERAASEIAGNNADVTLRKSSPAPKAESEKTDGQRTGSKPATPEAKAAGATQQEIKAAIARAEARFPALKGRFVVDETSKAAGSGGAYMLGGKVVINLADARIDLEGYDVDAIPARLDAVLEEEIIHLAQLEATNRLGEPMDRFYAALWNEFTPAQQRAAAAAYQGNFDQQLPWQKAAETVRMLIQHRADGRVTELTKAFSKNMPERLIALLKSAVEFLREVVATGKIPERVQQAIDAIEGILAEFEGKEATRNEGVTVEVPDTLRLIGDAIRDARNADPRLTAKRARELEFAVEDLDAALESMPEDQRRPFIDTAIADWLDSMPEEPEPEAAPEADAKPKAPRKNPYRKKALELIYSGDYKTIAAIHEYGKLERNPPIIGLILNRKRSAKKLTENEMARLRGAFDGMPTQGMFQGYGPKGRLAAEVLSILTVPYGQGESADTMASNIQPGWTPVELFAELTDELMQITRGERFKNQELDPNRDWTDEEIAADLERQAREAIAEAEADDIEPAAGTEEDEYANGYIGDDEILFASPAPPAFYSRLTSAIENADFGTSKAKPPGQWAGVILKWAQGRSSAGGALWNKGISKEELKWSGIMTWLESQKRPLTKAEVLGWLANEGAVRLQEVTFGAQALADVNKELEPYGFTLSQQDGEAIIQDENGEIFEIDEIPYADVVDILKRFERGRSEGAGTRYSQYTLTGGTNYREVVLAMPDQGGISGSFGFANEADLESYLEDLAMSDLFDFDYGAASGRTTVEVRNVNAEIFSRFKDAATNRGGWLKNFAQTGDASKNYTSSHFPGVPNYVAHMRTNERVDAAGKPGLFIEEIQSDRHQAGRRKGYREDILATKKSDALAKAVELGKFLYEVVGEEPAVADNAAVRAEKLADGNYDGLNLKQFPRLMREYLSIVGEPGNARARWVVDTVDKVKELAGEISEAKQIAERAASGIVDAPFRKDWPLAMFKRALRDAVAGGAEWIGWTTGETQAERFDLSQVIESITLIKRNGGKIDGQIEMETEGAHGFLTRYLKSEAELEEHIGKELAQRFMEMPWEDDTYGEYRDQRKTLEGLDLKVGGEGMKSFYDSMLPKEIGRYVKQWGGKVEKAGLRRPGYIIENPIWRIDITPEMRSGVQMGQALFSSRTGQGSFDFGTSGGFETRKGQMGFEFDQQAERGGEIIERKIDKVIVPEVLPANFPSRKIQMTGDTMDEFGRLVNSGRISLNTYVKIARTAKNVIGQAIEQENLSAEAVVATINSMKPGGFGRAVTLKTFVEKNQPEGYLPLFDFENGTAMADPTSVADYWSSKPSYGKLKDIIFVPESTRQELDLRALARGSSDAPFRVIWQMKTTNPYYVRMATRNEIKAVFGAKFVEAAMQNPKSAFLGKATVRSVPALGSPKGKDGQPLKRDPKKPGNFLMESKSADFEKHVEPHMAKAQQLGLSLSDLYDAIRKGNAALANKLAALDEPGRREFIRRGLALGPLDPSVKTSGTLFPMDITRTAPAKAKRTKTPKPGVSASQELLFGDDADPDTPPPMALFSSSSWDTDSYKVWRFPDEQEISSAETSINSKTPAAGFKAVKWQSGTVNADIGGGRFDNATEMLAGMGVQNVIFDPFNRSWSENKKAVSLISDGKADTATVFNVLNVIREPEVRELVIRQAANALKPGGQAYFQVYDGDKSGVGKKTPRGWQENRALETYLPEISRHFGQVRRFGQVITAEKPLRNDDVLEQAPIVQKQLVQGTLFSSPSEQPSFGRPKIGGQGMFDFGTTAGFATRSGQMGFDFNAPKQAAPTTKFSPGDLVRMDGKGPYTVESVGSDGWVYLANGNGAFPPDKAAQLLTPAKSFEQEQAEARAAEDAKIAAMPPDERLVYLKEKLRDAESMASLGADTFAERQRWKDASPEVQRLRAEIAKLEAAQKTLTAGQLAGKKIEGEWYAFGPESGTLGIPRSEMPQVKAEDRSALVQFLRARGVDYATEEVLPGTLRPTQAEYSADKVKRARNYTGGNRSILVSSDNHVVDGHHQWMAWLSDTPKEPMQVIRLKAPIRQLLPMVLEMPSAEASGTTARRPVQGGLDLGLSVTGKTQGGFDFDAPAKPKTAQTDLFGWASDTPKATNPTTTETDDQPRSTDLERNRQGADDQDGGREGGVPAGRRPDGGNGNPLDEAGGGSGDTAPGSPLSVDVPAARVGSKGDPELPAAAPAARGGNSGRQQPRGGGRRDGGGMAPDAGGSAELALDLGIPGGSTQPLAGGREEGSAEDSPLTPEQAGDVAFIERRLFERGEPGVLLTNGTGTGKTFSGLGAIKAALDRGEKHVIVVVPSDKVANDWKDTARDFFGIDDAHQLTGITDNGGRNRLVVTTYANFGQNANLVNRPWGMVVTDEAHYLSQNKQGNDTLALDALRALTWHKEGMIRRADMAHPQLAAERDELLKIDYRRRLESQNDRLDAINRVIGETRKEFERQRSAMAKADRPKVIMLSATPFAWHFSLDYAEGYLFEHGPEPESKGYNTPSARDAFYIENFGYRMRTGKLTTPDAAAATATGILERRFAEKLMKEGAMAGRALVVPRDYSRQFVLSETQLGAKIDEILKFIQDNKKFAPLSEFIGIGNYLGRRYLLEGIKARESVARIRKHLALGRKVVVFHDYKKGGALNPLRANLRPGDVKVGYDPDTRRSKDIDLYKLYQELKQSIPDWDQTERELDGLLSPITVFQREFGDRGGIFNGSVGKTERRNLVKRFNKSGSGLDVLLVQRASGKEGISLHDVDNKHQRAFIDLGIAGRPTDAIQGEGRIYRFGVQSDAVFEYLTTGTNFERWTFAQTIAQRSSTAENLAMGERARALLQSFATGYNEAEVIEPNPAQGTGGKEMDRRIAEATSYQTAKALFFTNQKKTSRTKAAEGIDYFATPEPLGFKMVEWADIQAGEKILEPSAGHGAIARFFPDATNRHAVEPSNELAGRLALNATDTIIHNETFEEFHLVNKFDAVVMNPPFGTAGNLAMQHLVKALKHLREGGRVIALIPEGATMAKRFDAWMESDASRDFHLRATVRLPSVTFSRAGTNVNARIVVIDRLSERFSVERLSTVSRDLSSAETLDEFFERLEFITVPQRPEVPEIVKQTTEAAENPGAALIQGGRGGMLPKVPVPEVEGTWAPAECIHGKTGETQFVVKIMRRLNDAEYAAAKARAKALGGYYSSFRGNGAIPGFQFKSAEARDAFIGAGERPADPGQALQSSASRGGQGMFDFGATGSFDTKAGQRGFDFGQPAQPAAQGAPAKTITDPPETVTNRPQTEKTVTPAAKPAESARIEDFGEKILGARKDTWGKFKTAIEQELPEDGADITVAKYFPEPDYEAAKAAGISEDALATYKALRDTIPAKPRQPYKLRRWVETVRALHPFMQRLVQGEELKPAEYEALQRLINTGTRLGEKINFYRDLGYPAFTKADDWKILTGVTKFMRNGVKLETPERIQAALYKDRFVDGMESTDLDRPGYIEVINKVRARILAELQDPTKKPKKPMEFSVLMDRRTGDHFIGKKAVNGWVRLKTGFADAKEAFRFMADHRQELEDQWEGLKKPVDYRKQVNEPREGPERRPGDVTPEMFADAFGFRGVQFGNWVEGDRRQVDINEAFDAFMDMAEALGIPPKAVSLDGSLGLAFGARGIPNAKAHYEPDHVVINLSKKSGPGSLAHEWFHAFDNYFARIDRLGDTAARPLDKYATTYSPAPKNMRPEVWDAFKAIRLAVDSGPFAERSKKLDETKSKPYYSQTIEKAARAFERYTVDRLAKMEISNDFLVNLVKGDDPALPTQAEMDAGIRQAYDQLFNALDTKETERGVALFSSPSQPDLFAATSAPDAKEKLGSVKIGSKNALGAYRALTAKRAAGKALTPEEEETLLQAETALGQKMAFDMQAVTGTAPAVDTGSSPAPAGPKRQKDIQQSLGLGGEVLKDGQMTLFSSSVMDFIETNEDSDAYDRWNDNFWDWIYLDPERQKKTPTFEDHKKAGREVLTPEQAAARLAEWKKIAREDSGNSDKVVLSLFDTSGVISQPWVDAGYTVYRMDLDPNSEVAWQVDVMDLTRDFMIDNGLDMVDVVLAQPPCTDFASSGARWFAEKDEDGRTKHSIAMVQHTLDVIGWLKPSLYLIENPIGRIRKLTGLPEPRLVMDPFIYGDPYTKRTQLWGMFNENLPEAVVEPTEGSRIFNLRGDDPEQKKLRSLTPEGFAYAFYVANRDFGRDHWERVQKFQGLALAKQPDLFDAAPPAKAEPTAEATPAAPLPTGKAVQQSLMLPGEMGRGGQLSLFSSATPNVPGYSRRAKYLTEQERSNMRKNVAERFVEIFDTLPSAQEMAGVALGGIAKRGWYRRSAEALLEVFGMDAPRFAALLAAMSPQTSVESNLRNALRTWANWVKAGRPTDKEAILDIMGMSVERTPLDRMNADQIFKLANNLGIKIPAETKRQTIAGSITEPTTAADVAWLIRGSRTEEQIARASVLPAWINNSVRALTAENPEELTLSGPKVNSFMLNLRGVTNEVTNDAWMANYALVDQKIFSGSLSQSGPGKGAGYLAMSARTRAAAEYLTKLTGEKWTPAEVQETVWSWAKTLYELQLPTGEDRTALELLRDGEVTEERIAATPDFAILLLDEQYRKILDQSGYTEAMLRLERKHPEDARVSRYRSEREADAANSDAARKAREKAAKRLTLLREQRVSASEETQLFSSPTPESQAAVEQALEKMPPIYRAVFQAVSDGMDEAATAQKFGISAKAVTNILNAVRSRITVATRAAAGTLQPAMRDGKFDGGRPDLAEGAKPDFVAVDQIRNESNIPGEYSRDESRAEATRRLDADYEAEFDRLFRMINENRPPNDVDVAMAKEIFRRETMSGRLDDPARRVKVALFRVAYRDMGSAQSRAFSMRIDEEMTPAERHALHLTELLYEPSPDVKARLKKADPATKESILKKWMAQIDAFKAEMAAQGLDIDAAIRAFNQREEATKKAMEESPRAAAAFEETFEKLTKREKLVIQAIRSGAKLSGIVAQTGFTREEILEIHRRFETGWRAAMAAAAKRFLEASLAASPGGDVMGQIMAELGWQSIDDLDDLDPAYEQKQELKRKEAEAIRKVRQQRPKPKPKDKPAFVTTPQQEARWKALADLWRNSPLSTWRTLWETEMRNLGPIFGVSFERARDEFLAPWRALWQTEMDLRPQDGRMTFEEWMERPETREKWKKQPELFAEPINERTGDWNETQPLPMTGQAELNRAPINETTGPNEKKTAVGQGNLGLFPINETTGTFDINDPRPMAYLANEWARRNGTWINKAIEWFKMSILSGLQTIAINAMGGLHVAYTVGPRRAMEAAWNDLLNLFGADDVRSATLSEFLPMLKHVRASMRLAANQGIRAWQLESPVFESYAEGKPVQLEFSGVGPEFAPPALATATWNELVNDKSFKNAIGFVNRLMRNITFRELTATDEFWKGLYAQLDVAAIAHRIAAKEENLTGDAYAKRAAELMKPGSVAWSRVMPRTKTATFQDRLAYGEWTKEDEKKNPAHRAGTSMTWQQAFEKSQTESAWTILDAFGALAMDARKLPMIGPILHMFALPFIITPKNLIQRGLEVTPLGLVVDLIDGMRSFRRRIHSGRITAEESRRIAGELYNKARFIQLLTNQSIGLMAYLALEGLSEGDEDDEYGRPFITGTMPWTTTKRGEIDIANEVMPPQSVRIGNTIIPYKRFDPFSTIVASLVDMGVSLRRNDGEFNGQAVTDLIVSLKEQTKDKLFLKGLGDIIRVVEDPHRGADRLAAGYVTGFVPNLIRQPIRETDSVQRDKNPMADAGFFEAVAQRVGYDLFPRTAPAKIDIWGDPVPANRGELLGGSKPLDAAFRVIDPTNATFGGKVRPISAWIYRYNMMQPDSSDRIGIQPYPGEISVTFPGQPRPVKVPLTPAEIEEANRNIGQMAIAMLGENWDWRTANAPEARQRAELIADTFTNLRRAETQRLKLKKLAEGPPKE